MIIRKNVFFKAVVQEKLCFKILKGFFHLRHFHLQIFHKCTLKRGIGISSWHFWFVTNKLIKIKNADRKTIKYSKFSWFEVTIWPNNLSTYTPRFSTTVQIWILSLNQSNSNHLLSNLSRNECLKVFQSLHGKFLKATKNKL